jgi:FixJ family two-component response regulator
MSRVLLVDDDDGTLWGWKEILCHAGFDVLTADRGRKAIELACREKPDVILTDLRLADISGLELLQQLREQQHIKTPVVVVTGFASIESAVEAIKLGAINYVEKPIIGDEIVRVVKLGLAASAPKRNESADSDVSTVEAHAASRWARVVVRVIDAPSDPRTLHSWGRLVGASPGTLKNWCRMVGLSSKRSLDFARVLRAVVRQKTAGARPQDSLDVVDRRTLRRLLSLGRSKVDASGLPQHVEEFLQTQLFIKDTTALVELRRALISP